MFILKSYAQSPPGNYYYVQSENIRHTFQAVPIIEELAKTVSSFRIANKLRRASLSEALEDIDLFTCARLKNDPNFCRDCKESYQQIQSEHRFIKPACQTCGKPVS